MSQAHDTFTVYQTTSYPGNGMIPYNTCVPEGTLVVQDSRIQLMPQQVVYPYGSVAQVHVAQPQLTHVPMTQVPVHSGWVYVQPEYIQSAVPNNLPQGVLQVAPACQQGVQIPVELRTKGTSFLTLFPFSNALSVVEPVATRIKNKVKTREAAEKKSPKRKSQGKGVVSFWRTMKLTFKKSIKGMVGKPASTKAFITVQGRRNGGR